MDMSEDRLSVLARGLFIGIFFIAAVFGALLILLFTLTPHTSASSNPPAPIVISDNPNIVSVGFAKLSNSISRAAYTTTDNLNQSFAGISSTIFKKREINMPKVPTPQIEFPDVASQMRSGSIAIGLFAHSSLFSVVSLPYTLVSLVADTAPVNALIKPANTTDVPTITPLDPFALDLHSNHIQPVAVTAASHVEPVVPQNDVWPTPGRITTFFGVPHRPFQTTHTGLDISDGRGSGISPVVPFRAGTVIETVRGNHGLGNHIVIDHGAGLTSLYAHLHSINVTVGQAVTTASVLGKTGSTGVSTGTHLHLEIRENGVSVDPLKYIHR